MLLQILKTFLCCLGLSGHREIAVQWHTEPWMLSWSFSEADRDSSSLSSPREVSSRQPWVPVQLLPLSGGGQRVRDKALCDTELSA